MPTTINIEPEPLFLSSLLVVVVLVGAAVVAGAFANFSLAFCLYCCA